MHSNIPHPDYPKHKKSRLHIKFCHTVPQQFREAYREGERRTERERGTQGEGHTERAQRAPEGHTGRERHTERAQRARNGLTERAQRAQRGREAYGEGERHTERERQEVGAKMSKNATELSLPLFFHA